MSTTEDQTIDLPPIPDDIWKLSVEYSGECYKVLNEQLMTLAVVLPPGLQTCIATWMAMAIQRYEEQKNVQS